MNNKQEGYIEIDGNLVSEAAKKAYNHYKSVDEKKQDELDKFLKKLKDEENYFLNGEAQKDFIQAERDCTDKVEVERTILVDKIFSIGVTRKKVKEKVSNKSTLLKLLKNKSEYWTERKVEIFIHNNDPHELFKISVYGYAPPSLYYHSTAQKQAPFFEQFFDLTGKVIISLSHYQQLKEWM